MIRKTLIPQVPGSISIGVFYHGMGAFLLLNALVPGDWKAIKVTGVPNSMIAIKNGGMPYMDSGSAPDLVRYGLVKGGDAT